MKRSGNSIWLVRQLTPSSVRIVLSLTLAVLSGILSTTDPIFMRRLIDQALPFHRNLEAILLTMAIGGCFFGRHVFLNWSRSIDFDVQQTVAQNLRISLLEQLNRLSADYHERIPVGERLRRLEGDVDQTSELGAEFTSTLCRAAIFFIVNLAVMVSLSHAMTLAILPALVAFGWAWGHYGPKLERHSQEARAELGRASSILLEFLAAIPQIQLLCSEKLVRQKAVGVWTGLVSARRTQRNIEIRLMLTIGCILVLANVLVLGVGSLQVLRGTLTIGSLVAFYGFTTRTFEPVSSLLDLYSRLEKVGANIEAVRSVLQTEPTVADFGTISEPLSTVQQGLSFNRVTFSYTAEQTVLREFNLFIGPRDRVGIVGRSGSGKSTVARLLARVSDPQGGDILLDGYPLREYKLDAVRRTIRYVPQFPLLFQGSVEENLRYGNPEASRRDLERVIEVAHLAPVLSRLPAGLASELGPHGHSLSGGELQRLALARALIRPAPVVILDESTSALDLPTEQCVLEGISEHCSSSVLIIISHRVQSLTWMNRIVVLSSGKIVDGGSHDTLYSQCELYRNLYESVGVTVN